MDQTRHRRLFYAGLGLMLSGTLLATVATELWCTRTRTVLSNSRVSSFRDAVYRRVFAYRKSGA